MKTAIVGIEVPSEVRQTLEKALGGLHAGAFVAGENMHVAVADLGEQPDWMIDKLKVALDQVEVGPFYIKIEGLNTVGGQHPTAIYAEVVEAKPLKTLHRQVTRVARVEGVEIPHQSWSPGVTIARYDELEKHDMKLMLGFLQRRGGPQRRAVPGDRVRDVGGSRGRRQDRARADQDVPVEDVADVGSRHEDPRHRGIKRHRGAYRDISRQRRGRGRGSRAPHRPA